jgi:hypothetical protein
MTQNKMKDKKYIDKIRIIAKADIENGNGEKLRKVMDRLIRQEEYEDCAGIHQAFGESRRTDTK